LALQNLPASGYAIRKARKPDQLSTLEATCAALAQLEMASEKFEPIVQAFVAFNAFIAKQMKHA
jgi:DTW domain-containing protein YfiP